MMEWRFNEYIQEDEERTMVAKNREEDIYYMYSCELKSYL